MASKIECWMSEDDFLSKRAPNKVCIDEDATVLTYKMAEVQRAEMYAIIRVSLDLPNVADIKVLRRQGYVVVSAIQVAKMVMGQPPKQ